MTSSIIKSPNDKNEYRYVQLKNGLDVLLISNKTTTISSAALAVDAGSLEDGEVGGMAHFLEHMLFLGSEKYPSTEEFNNFIVNHGGMTNAYTAGNHTCYYFNIDADSFDTGLDMFGQFFISPLFAESALSREMNAVDSEYKKNITQDNWRLQEVINANCNKHNPKSKFSIGSLETLNIPKIREMVIDFYKNNYSSHLMKLVMVDKKSLDEMQKVAESIYSAVPKRDIVVNRNYQKPLDLPMYLNIVPISCDDKMYIYWQVPAHTDLHDHKPYSILGHILGHEGTGSILNSLKQSGLAHQLSAGIDDTVGNDALFCISIKLTWKGLKHKKAVYDIVKHYVELLLSAVKNDDKQVVASYEEMKYVSELSFKNHQIGDLTDYASGLAATWCEKHVPVTKLLSFPYLFGEYNKSIKEILVNILSMFVDKNCMIIISSKTYKTLTKNVEKWFGVEYTRFNNFDTLTNDSDYDITENTKNLSLVRCNPFICKNPSFVTEKKAKDPILIRNDKIQGYWKFDDSFGVPQIHMLCDIKVPTAMDSLKTSVMTALYMDCVKQIMNPVAYEYAVADYYAKFNVSRGTLTLKLIGYPEKFNTVLRSLVDYILLTTFDKQCFEMCKQKFKDDMINRLTAPPYTKVHSIINKQFVSKYYDHTDYLSVVDEISYDDVVNARKVFLEDIEIKCLLQGNLTQDSAFGYTNELQRFVEPCKNKCCRESVSDWKIVKQMSSGSSAMNIQPCENKDEKNSVTSIYYNIGYYRPMVTKDWANVRVLAELLDMCIGKDFYNDLRTTQQLGYIVNAGMFYYGVNEMPFMAYRFLVQSNHKDSKYLSDRIDEFIKKTSETLKKLSDEEFQTYVSSYVQLLNDPEKTLAEAAENNFYSIITTDNVFDHKDLLTQTAKTVTKGELISFYKEYIVGKKCGMFIAGFSC